MDYPPPILASLTHLVLTELPDPHNVDLLYLLNILSQSPNLIELRTEIAMSSLSSSVFTRTGERIFCANLRRLHLQLFTYNPSQYPLLHFEAPALRELIMYCHVNQLPPISDVLPITLIDLNALDVQAARVTHQKLRCSGFTPTQFLKAKCSRTLIKLALLLTSPMGSYVPTV